MTIDRSAFIHPEDTSALKALQAIPGHESLVKAWNKYMATEYAKSLVSRVVINERQLPKLYRILQEICEKLEMDVPKLFLEMSPWPDFLSSGVNIPQIVVTSKAIEMLRPDEFKAMLAHECGHFLCGHVTYSFMPKGLMSTWTDVLGQNLLSAPLEAALNYWLRYSDYSADRVAAFVMGNETCIARALARLTGGDSPVMDGINLEEFAKQAEEVEQHLDNSSKSKLLHNLVVKDCRCPFPVLRIAELHKWFTQSKAPESVSSEKLRW